MKDQELIEALKLGDTQVLRYCYEHLPTMLSYVLQNSGSEEDAHDVFQEALMAFYHNVIKDRFELTSSLNTYIVSIGKNIWKNKLRSARKTDVTIEPIKDDGLVTEDNFEMEVQDAKIARVMKILQEPCKSILNKYYYQNLSLKVIAETMGYKSEQVARQQKYKCMKKIKEQVKQELIKVES